MESEIKKFIMKEFDKKSFLNDNQDVCFLTRKDIEEAVQKGIQNLIDKLKS